MYFERWGLLLSKGDFYGVFNVLNAPTTCVLNTLLTTQQRGVHNVALSPQAEQRYILETLKTILPTPTSDNYLRHRLKDKCLSFLSDILYHKNEWRARLAFGRTGVQEAIPRFDLTQ
jgi:hypothetical protein